MSVVKKVLPKIQRYVYGPNLEVCHVLSVYLPTPTAVQVCCGRFIAIANCTVTGYQPNPPVGAKMCQKCQVALIGEMEKRLGELERQ